jgi:hypothetical protein
MPTPKQAIAEALQSLDHSNDAHWTDDGAPLVSEIQRLTNDKTITRAQINDALPGFARKSADSITEDEQDLGDETSGVGNETGGVVASSEVQEGDDFDGIEEDAERLRKIAYQRVVDAQKGIDDAKNAVSEAQRAVVAAEQRHTRALQLYSSKYPPLTAAENIKQHLARQAEIQRERITGYKFEPNSAQNPVDATLMDRKRNNGKNKPPATKFLPRSLAVS